MKKSVIVYLGLFSVFTFFVGFATGSRLMSQRKDKVFGLTNDFVLSTEVSTQLDMHSYLGEAMLRDDQESKGSAMKQLGTQIQFELQRIAEDRSGVGQLTNQQKNRSFDSHKGQVAGESSSNRRRNQEAEQAGHGDAEEAF